MRYISAPQRSQTVAESSVVVGWDRRTESTGVIWGSGRGSAIGAIIADGVPQAAPGAAWGIMDGHPWPAHSLGDVACS